MPKLRPAAACRWARSATTSAWTCCRAYPATVAAGARSRPARAGEVFDALDGLRAAGKVGAYGWSTDFPDRASAHAGRDGFVAVEHAMNVFFRADRLTPVLDEHGLLALVRSPLAMGLLSGKYDATSRISADDVRSRFSE